MSIPKGWQEVRLGDIGQIVGGGTPLTTCSDFWDNGDIVWLTPTEIDHKYITDSKRKITQKGLENSSAKILPINTILISTRATIGEVGIAKVECCTNQGFQSLICGDSVNHEFIYYLIKNEKETLLKLACGTTFLEISPKSLKSIKIKLPQLKEQEKIAEILSSCDEHIKNLKNLKSELEKEKLHLMNELLSGKTRFANFTTPWQEVALKDLGEYRRGSFPQPYGNKEWYDGEGSMPFVQVFDVDDNFKLKPTTLKRISKLAQPKSIFIPKGSVIITIQGSIGRTAITQYDCYLDRTLLYFEKFLIPIDKKFFMYALFSVFEVEKLKAPGGTIKTITKEALSDFKIKLPSLEEQKKIGEVLSACDERLECLNELITAQTTLKSHLLTELLTGNIRVKDYE